MSEIVVILVVALVFLGPKKLPELASGIGKMIRELRKATSDIKNEIELDETIRKPVEELREAMTLHPEELKRRDLERAAREAREKAEREEEEKRKAAEAAAAKVPEAATPSSPAATPSSPSLPATPSSLSLPVASNGDKTIAMPTPSFANGGTPVGGIPVAKAPPGTVARPTLVGVPPSPAVPRPAPPPVPPGAAKLPAPGGAARPVPSPPVKKD